jgi:hypothetical protein
MNVTFTLIALGVISGALSIVALLLARHGSPHAQRAIHITDGTRRVSFDITPTMSPKVVTELLMKYGFPQSSTAALLPEALAGDKRSSRYSESATSPPPSLAVLEPSEDDSAAEHERRSRPEARSPEPPRHEAPERLQHDLPELVWIEEPESAVEVGRPPVKDLPAKKDPTKRRASARQVRFGSPRPTPPDNPGYFSGSEAHDDRYADKSLVAADFTHADLDRAGFRGADLRTADFQDASLVDADLSSARLDYANLARANLLRAKLAGASLYRAKLTGANLAAADLREANLREAEFDINDLEGAQWDETTVWSPEVEELLYNSSSRVFNSAAGTAVFEVGSNPEAEEIGAGIRRR